MLGTTKVRNSIRTFLIYNHDNMDLHKKQFFITLVEDKMLNPKSIIHIILCFLLTTVSVLASDERDDWQLLLRPGILDAEGLTYGEFVKCLETADFPLDSGPRKVSSLLTREGVKVTVNNHTFKFFTRSDDGYVLINSISLGGDIVSSIGEKVRLVILFLENCPMMIERREEQAK